MIPVLSLEGLNNGHGRMSSRMILAYARRVVYAQIEVNGYERRVCGQSLTL